LERLGDKSGERIFFRLAFLGSKPR